MTNQDPEIGAIEIDRMVAYLSDTGWELLPHPNLRLLLFQGSEDDYGNPIQIVLPSSTEFWDSSLLLAKATNLLALLEERSPYDVMEEIESTPLVGPTWIEAAIALFAHLPPLSDQEQDILIQLITPLQDDLEILATHLRQWIGKRPDLDQPFRKHAADLILGRVTLKGSSRKDQIPLLSTTKERLLNAIRKKHS